MQSPFNFLPKRMHIFTSRLKLTIILILLLALHSSATPKNNPSNTNAAYEPWLKKVLTKNPRWAGCRHRPWICRRDDRKRVWRRCCRDRCVEVSSDPNNCGLCGVRCPFTWQCCRGICVDTNRNPFNCGGCGRRCLFPRLCFYGMCGYAQPLPPFPFPFPPKPWPRPRPHPPPPA